MLNSRVIVFIYELGSKVSRFQTEHIEVRIGKVLLFCVKATCSHTSDLDFTK